MLSNAEYDQLKTSISVLHKLLKQNMEAIEDLEKKTEGVVEAFEAAKGAFKVLNFLASITKPFIWLGTVATAGYGLFIGMKHLLLK